MLVDDNDTDNYISKRIMEISNFADVIDVKNSGRNALDFIENNEGNLNILPELIFLDINMPLVDGFHFLDEFENFLVLKEKCKIVILTSHYNFYYMSKIINNPHVISYVTKPLSEDVLKEIKIKLSFIKNENMN